MGPSQVVSLVVRLTSLTNDESAIKGKQRVLSELKEDVSSKLRSQLLPLEAEASTSSSSNRPKSINRMLSRLSTLSKVMDAASKVRYQLLSCSSLITNGCSFIQVHPLIDSSWTTITQLHEVCYFHV